MIADRLWRFSREVSNRNKTGGRWDQSRLKVTGKRPLLSFFLLLSPKERNQQGFEPWVKATNPRRILFLLDAARLSFGQSVQERKLGLKQITNLKLHFKTTACRPMKQAELYQQQAGNLVQGAHSQKVPVHTSQCSGSGSSQCENHARKMRTFFIRRLEPRSPNSQCAEQDFLSLKQCKT